MITNLSHLLLGLSVSTKAFSPRPLKPALHTRFTGGHLSALSAYTDESVAASGVGAASKHIGFDDIQPGDILCFSASGPQADDLSTVIALLTGDDVSHAAMVTRDKSQLVEQVMPHITQSPLIDAKRFGGRNITVSRLQDIDMEKVQEQADFYLKQGDNYGYLPLVFIGLRLLAKHPENLSNPILYRAILSLLKEVAGNLKSVTETMQHEQRKSWPMFCSQFVSQCYIDAEFPLEIDNPALRGFAPEESEDTILDYVINQVDQGELKAQDAQLFNSPTTPMSEDAILKELREALEAPEEAVVASDSTTRSGVEPELACAIVDLALAYDAMTSGDASSLYAENDQDRLLSALGKVKAANSITPGDLTRIANKNGELIGSFMHPLP